MNTELLTYFIDKLYEVHNQTLSNPDEFVLDDGTLGRFVRLEQPATIRKCAKLFWKLFYSHDFEYGLSDTAVENSVIDFMKVHERLVITYNDADVNNNHLAIALTLLAMAVRRIDLVPKPPTAIRWDYDLADILRIIITDDHVPPNIDVEVVLKGMFARCYYHNDITFGVVRYKVRDGWIQKCCYITHIYPHHRPAAEFRGLADYYIDRIVEPDSRLKLQQSPPRRISEFQFEVIGNFEKPAVTTGK